MDWEYIITEVFVTFIKMAIIYSCYSFTKYYVQVLRKDKKKKASVFEIVAYIISILIISSIIGGVTGGGNPNKSMILFLLFGLPSLIGLWGALEIDAKLSPEERKKIQIKIEKE